jgi:hypothetical protein
MASYTSIVSYRQLKLSGMDIKERDLVLNLMRSNRQPLNSRQISRLTGIERTNITRTLHDLEKAQKIMIAKIDKCPSTHKLVQFYSIND